MAKLPYGDVERDLNALAVERAGNAVRGVAQLCDTKGQAFMVFLSVAGAAAASTAAAYDAWQGKPFGTTTAKEMMSALYDGIDEVLAEETSHG
jgi:hypothetical protein